MDKWRLVLDIRKYVKNLNEAIGVKRVQGSTSDLEPANNRLYGVRISTSFPHFIIQIPSVLCAFGYSLTGLFVSLPVPSIRYHAINYYQHVLRWYQGIGPIPVSLSSSRHGLWRRHPRQLQIKGRKPLAPICVRAKPTADTRHGSRKSLNRTLDSTSGASLEREIAFSWPTAPHLY